MTAFIHRLSASQPDAILDKMIEEITDKLQAGESVDLSEYTDEEPARLERLRRLLPALKMIAELGDSAVAIPAIAGSEQDASHGRMGTLGDFRLVHEVGRGGMGVVYEAEQMSLDRRVALKVLPFAATLDPKQLQRFKSEAQAAAHLHHTNIVPVFAVGCERGVHYYAMQFIEGQSLAEAIKGLRQLTGLDPVDPSCVINVRPELAASLGSGSPSEVPSPLRGGGRLSGRYVENTPLDAEDSPPP